MRLHDRTAALTSLAGYSAQDPLMVGVQQDSAPPVFLTSGRTVAGEPLTADTIVYTASLSNRSRPPARPCSCNWADWTPNQLTHGPSASASTQAGPSTGTAVDGPG
jgi:hypothetical protein